MNWNRGCRNHKSSSSEAGFTLIEVLVSVVVLSVVSASVYMSFSAIIKLIHIVPKAAEKNQKLLVLDTILRGQLGKVRFPFWIPEYDFTLDSEEAVLPYYEGQKDKYLYIGLVEDQIVMSTYIGEEMDEETSVYKAGPFEYVYFDVFEEDDTGVAGLQMTMKLDDEVTDEFVLTYRFGAQAFWRP